MSASLSSSLRWPSETSPLKRNFLKALPTSALHWSSAIPSLASLVWGYSIPLRDSEAASSRNLWQGSDSPLQVRAK